RPEEMLRSSCSTGISSAVWSTPLWMTGLYLTNRPDQVSRIEEAGISLEASTPGRPARVQAKRADNVVLGIGFMVASTVLFAATPALAKWLTASYPVGEVMFFRSLSSLVVCSIVVLPFTGFSVFATKRPRDHLARGLSQSISQTFTVLAVSMMPLAGAI